MAEIIKTANGKHRLKLKCLSYIMKDGRIRADATCEFQIKVGSHGETNSLQWWNWDGEHDAPTIMPSVHCAMCGLHVTVNAGVENGRPPGPYTMRNYSVDGNVYDEHGKLIP